MRAPLPSGGLARIAGRARRRRVALLAAILLATYLSTLGLRAFGAAEYAGDEPHYLLAAHSLVNDGDLDVSDEYRDRAYRTFYPYPLDRHGAPRRDGALLEPHGVGMPVLIAPAYALGGAKLVEVWLALLATAAMLVAYFLARRVVPDPWAFGATLAVGLSPPLVAYGTAVYPELPAALLLGLAMLLTLRLADERPRAADALAAAFCLALLPWLGTKFALPGVAVAGLLWRTLMRGRRPGLAAACVNLLVVSGVAFVEVNRALYGGATPYAADLAGESATDAAFPHDYLDRVYRFAALFLDREYGLLRWAPIFALSFVGLFLLRASVRSGLARALPEQSRAERCARACALVAAAQLVVAALLAPTMFGFWFPPRHLLAALPLATPLVAWGTRRLPRLALLLAVAGMVATVAVWLAGREGGGLVVAKPAQAPFGPLVELLPLYGTGTLWPYLLGAGFWGALLALLVFSELRHSRQTAGNTRARYSG